MAHDHRTQAPQASSGLPAPATQVPSYWLAQAAQGAHLPNASASLGLGLAAGGPAADAPLATREAAPLVDVAVIGAGLCGTTLAWLLREAGLSVALIDARRVGEQASALGSGVVSALHAPGWNRLAEQFGQETAASHAQAHAEAVATVARLCETLALDCGFERLAAYSWAQKRDTVATLRDEEAAMRTLGLQPDWADRVDALPFPSSGALKLDAQARIDPLRFVRELAARFSKRGGLVLEHTRIVDVDEDAQRVVLRTDRGTLTAGQAVLATGLPFTKMGNWFAEAFPRAQVLMAVRLAAGTPLPDGLWQTADEPRREFHVLRDAPGGPVAIVTGRAFKTGEVDTRAPRIEVDGWLREFVQVDQVLHSWTAEHWESMDGLPFVGHLARNARRLWVATGLGPQASTAVAAALVLAERVQGREHRWSAAYDSGRINAGISVRKFLSENLDVAKKWIHDHVSSAPVADADALTPGEAALVAGDGATIAAYRDDAGRLHAVDATCTHMGCTVAWNAVSTCWDCPCHGSRFSIDGQVLHGPATQALAPPRWTPVAGGPGRDVEPDAYRRAVDPEAATFETPDAANMRPGLVPEAAPPALYERADRGDAYRRAVDPEAATFETPDAANMRPGVVPEAAPTAAVRPTGKDKPRAG